MRGCAKPVLFGRSDLAKRAPVALSGRIVVRVVPLAAETRPSVNPRSSSGLGVGVRGLDAARNRDCGARRVAGPGARPLDARAPAHGSHLGQPPPGGRPRRRTSDDDADASTPPTPSTDRATGRQQRHIIERNYPCARPARRALTLTSSATTVTNLARAARGSSSSSSRRVPAGGKSG